MEIGCGIGSTVAPLLGNCRAPHLDRVTCVDVSPVAIARLRRRGLPTVRGLVADITQGGVPDGAPYDIVTFIFCLSAVPVDKMHAAARNAIASVRSGGVLYFRDYATDDLAQGRGPRGRPTWERLTKEEEDEDGQTTSYLRRNGTLSHFFSLEEVRGLFGVKGVTEALEERVVQKEVVNRKDDVTMHRCFVQCRYRVL